MPSFFILMSLSTSSDSQRFTPAPFILYLPGARRSFNIPCWTPRIGDVLKIRTPSVPQPTPMGQPLPLLSTADFATGSSPLSHIPVRVTEQLLSDGIRSMNLASAIKKG